jgi:hypothetical protein
MPLIFLSYRSVLDHWISALGHRHHPTNGLLDKSVLDGSWIVVVAQTLVDTHARRAASLIDLASRIFKDLDASHPSERANLYDGQP